MRPLRMVAVWCPDWPVVALDAEAIPAAVMHGHRVMAVSPVARASGVIEGLRRREAQRRCPEINLTERDLDAEVRAFDRVVAALESVTPWLEVVSPGLCAFPSGGPSRFFGGDEMLLDRIRSVLAPVSGGGSCVLGIADGLFAATSAARLGRQHAAVAGEAVAGDAVVSDAVGTPAVVPPGATPDFVAPLPIGWLDQPGLGADRTALIDVLRRLGIRRLGDLAALSAADVSARFGREGLLAHRLASGTDEHLPDLVRPPADLDCTIELDPPADRVDRAAFAGKSLADGFIGALEARGLSCLRVRVRVETAGGAVIERAWRHEGSLDAPAVAQRIRWQIDGWLSRRGRAGGAVTRIALHPEQVLAAVGRQEQLWGGASAADERARRGAARVGAILGAGAVRTPRCQGGRGPAEQQLLLPVDVADAAGAGAAAAPDVGRQPWPGRLPPPHPARVHPRPRPVEVHDADGMPVTVDGRGLHRVPPVAISFGGAPWKRVSAWAGPWVSDERWWDPVGHRRRARFQVLLEDGSAHLVALEAGSWWVEATYD